MTLNWHLFQFDPQYILVIAARLLVACVLGGIVGFEREHTRHKPAGFRTHILVCMGASLATMISEFAFIAFSDVVNVDPTRIGAQVVSGIGFWEPEPSSGMGFLSVASQPPPASGLWHVSGLPVAWGFTPPPFWLPFDMGGIDIFENLQEKNDCKEIYPCSDH